MQISTLARSTILCGVAAVVALGIFGSLVPGAAQASEDEDPWYLPLIAETNEDGVGTTAPPLDIDSQFGANDPRRVEVAPHWVTNGATFALRLRAFQPHERVELRTYRYAPTCPNDRCWEWVTHDVVAVSASGNADLQISTGGWPATDYRFCTTSGASCHDGYAEFTVNSATPVPLTPDTCQPGYVWRNAFAGDHVCVHPTVRTQAAADNGQAAARREPGGGAYGPNTCRSGYVWREASASDLVCVPPETRAQAASDNAHAAERRIGG